MDYLMLVDRFNGVPEAFENGLILERIQDKLLESQACRQCRALIEAARRDGVEIKILSAYRSCDYQQALWQKSISQLVGEGMDYAAAVKEVGKTLAKAGHSEHNCGLAVDFSTPQADDTEDDFYASAQGKWLCKNAYRYGFILRYPRMKEHLTGFSYEPWHYRYVGSEAAAFI